MPTQQTSSAKSGSASRNKPVPSRGSSAANSATRERDEVYGLVSVIYHALQGAETYTRYVQDAQAADDQELVEFFEECRDEEADRADRAKSLLAVRMDALNEHEGDEDEDDEEVEDDDES